MIFFLFVIVLQGYGATASNDACVSWEPEDDDLEGVLRSIAAMPSSYDDALDPYYKSTQDTADLEQASITQASSYQHLFKLFDLFDKELKGHDDYATLSKAPWAQPFTLLQRIHPLCALSKRILKQKEAYNQWLWGTSKGYTQAYPEQLDALMDQEYQEFSSCYIKMRAHVMQWLPTCGISHKELTTYRAILEGLQDNCQMTIIGMVVDSVLSHQSLSVRSCEQCHQTLAYQSNLMTYIQSLGVKVYAARSQQALPPGLVLEGLKQGFMIVPLPFLQKYEDIKALPFSQAYTALIIDQGQVIIQRLRQYIVYRYLFQTETGADMNDVCYAAAFNAMMACTFEGEKEAVRDIFTLPHLGDLSILHGRDFCRSLVLRSDLSLRKQSWILTKLTPHFDIVFSKTPKEVLQDKTREFSRHYLSCEKDVMTEQDVFEEILRQPCDQDNNRTYYGLLVQEFPAHLLDVFPLSDHEYVIFCSPYGIKSHVVCPCDKRTRSYMRDFLDNILVC